jgi:hypothetical protein
LSVSRPIEVVVLNCWVTETNDTLCWSNSSTSLLPVHSPALPAISEPRCLSAFCTGGWV